MALVFIPLLLLAGLGVRGLQMSRHAAREGARREVERAVRNTSQLFDSALDALRTTPPPRLHPVLPSPSPPNEAQELYNQALDAAPEQSLSLLEALASRHADAFTASGLPLLPFVQWRLLQMAKGDVALAQRAEELARAAVETHPSVLTPELLGRAEAFLRERGVEGSALRVWRQRWQEGERVRRAFRTNETFLSSAQTSVWVQSDDGLWWAEHSGEGNAWRLLSKERLVAAASAVLEQVRGTLPDYLAVEISFGAVPLLEQNGGERLAQMEGNAFLVAGVLRDPVRLYAEQHQQTLWLAALLGCAVVAALGVTWTMSVALAREKQLNELKSDFVSSVSHELRAPVASMRIMAENLGSGIVKDESRRREYHQLIADECWRLSTLIPLTSSADVRAHSPVQNGHRPRIFPPLCHTAWVLFRLLC